jgi:hypothetical protein
LSKIAEREDEIRKITESFNQEKEKNVESEAKIKQLNEDLESVRKLLDELQQEKALPTLSENCYENFIKLNNILVKRKNIIEKIQKVINTGIEELNLKLGEENVTTIVNNFKRLESNFQNSLKRLDVKDQTDKLIALETYLDAKSKLGEKAKNNIREKEVADFCEGAEYTLKYYDMNKADFNRFDLDLINIYEDLSGAVRVYVRIKPLKVPTNVVKVNNKKIDFQCDTLQQGQTEKQQEQSKVEQKYGVKSPVRQGGPRAASPVRPTPVSTRQTIKKGGAGKTKPEGPIVMKNIKQQFGDFYGVFGPEFSNEEVYTGIDGGKVSSDYIIPDLENIQVDPESNSPGLFNVFNQIKDGYSVILFGYGLSGSGKTFTLLGADENKEQNRTREYGLLHYGLGNLNAKRIGIKNIFEQYVESYSYTTTPPSIKSNIINLVGKLDIGKNEDFELQGLDKNDIKVEELHVLTKQIENYRKTKKRIKKTPNNPESSRSHLYMIFEIEFEKVKGYLTIIDMAGRESPIDIVEQHFDKTMSVGSIISNITVKNTNAIIDKFLGSMAKEYIENADVDPNLKKKALEIVLDIFKEGLYINETINHLTYYFNKKNGKETSFNKQNNIASQYSVNDVYINPVKEYNNEIDERNNCMMISILNYLDNLSKEAGQFKPSKFIMMCNVRQEEKFCAQTKATLEFANNIKSS